MTLLESFATILILVTSKIRLTNEKRRKENVYVSEREKINLSSSTLYVSLKWGMI